jgi:large subunit ribosomal protein L1
MAASKKKQDEVVESTEAPLDTEDVATKGDEVSEDTGITEDITADLNEGDDAEGDSPEGEESHTTKAGRHSAKAVREAEAEATRKAAAAERSDEAVEESKPKPIQRPNPLKQHGKAYRTAAELVDAAKRYEIDEAITLAKQTAKTKFDASVELHINLGVDPRQADQMVRATVVLPSGTGKSLRVAVLAGADKQAEAKKAGAEIVSDGDLIAKIEKGQLDFDVLVATPDMMAKLGKVAKVLGPRGLMPNPKSGTVTTNVGAAVEQAKAGRVEFRIDKQAIVHVMIGKASFSEDKLDANIKALIDAILKAKPASAKGTYVNAITLTTSMGPGIKLDIQKAIAAANPKR